MTTIFFSWQSDLPNKTNRNLIENSIKLALKKMNQDSPYSLITEIDRDTKGVLGSPDIVDSILTKIDKCGLFIADISIINSSLNGKRTPNPNVLFELGYAINTHIFQGSQFMNGIYISEYMNKNINRNLDYVGITRFSNTCIYVLKSKKFY